MPPASNPTAARAESPLAWRLFQARMWREYVMAWDGRRGPERQAWVETILGISRAECLRRAWTNARLARMLNRRPRARFGWVKGVVESGEGEEP